VREHGLAGARLAREDVEAGREAQLGALDQQQVLDTQFGEHRLTVYQRRPTESRPRPLFVRVRVRRIRREDR